jgi:hypothetical protein
MKSCGTCTTCCKLLGIAELKKPVNQWCTHCKVGSGCTIYDSKPASCNEFECVWLQSFDGIPGGMPLALRPDKSKCVLSVSDQDAVVVHVDPGYPQAWRKEPMFNLLVRLASKMPVIVGVGDSREKKLLRWNGAQVVIENMLMSEPDENGMQFADVEKPVQLIASPRRA